MPYRITRRQSTYWDLRHAGGLDRIHFIGKEEFGFVEANADWYSVLEEHAVLIDYAFAWEEIYINAPIAAPEQTIAAITAAVHSQVGAWRVAARYLNPHGAERILKGGFGLLLAAPVPIADLSKSVLRAGGAQFTSLPGRAARWPRQALIADRNYVVARAFRIERVT